MSASPRPWAVGRAECRNVLPIVRKYMGGSDEVAQIYTDGDRITARMRADARLIVKAVNVIEPLLLVARQAGGKTHVCQKPRCKLCDALVLLGAVFPEWREWA